jgi:HD-like signal output (HDOD) protein
MFQPDTGREPARSSGAPAAENDAATIDRDDPVAIQVCRVVQDDLRAAQLEIPRLPHVAAPILEILSNPNISNQEVLRIVRMDPVLSGKIMERANSAVFAGSQSVTSLSTAILRLGLLRVSEIALELSSEMKVYHGRKRGTLLERLWKFSLGTALACESLAQVSVREARDVAFLTGLFHAVASPAIVTAIGRLERKIPAIPQQMEDRVLGLMNLLSTELTLQILSSWFLPKEIQNAVRLQNASVRERKGNPLAHLLVCGKLLATELGLGTSPKPINLETSKDFWHLRLDDREILDQVSRIVLSGMESTPKTPHSVLD